jgi:simple sugar transport system permease protein
MLKLEPRKLPSQGWAYCAPVLAVVLTCLSAFIVFGLMGKNAAGGMYEMFLQPIADPANWKDLAIKAAPLIMIGVGLSIGFRANVWNIGGEGQYIMGAAAGTGVALAFWDQSGPWILPLMAIAGFAGGAAYAVVPILLKTRYKVSEILTSLMLTYVAIHFLNWLVQVPWNDPDGHGMLQTRTFNDSETLPTFDASAQVHLGIPLAVLVAVIAWVVMERTIFGYAVRVVGSAPSAARHGGFSEKAIIWRTLLIGGGLSGLAGIFQAAGPFTQLTPNFPENYGYTAIVVAFLGRLHPLGIIAAGLVLAITYIGGSLAESAYQIPHAATGMFQAMMLFYLFAVDVLVKYRLIWKAPVKAIPQKAQGAAA